jgi:hypothetical protein
MVKSLKTLIRKRCQKKRESNIQYVDEENPISIKEIIENKHIKVKLKKKNVKKIKKVKHNKIKFPAI